MKLPTLKYNVIFPGIIFYIMIVSAILSVSFCSFGQLRTDTLEQICISRYKHAYRRSDGSLSLWRPKDSIYVHAREMYKDLFANIRVFSVGLGNCDDCPVGYYKLNRYTGAEAAVENIDSFNKEIGKNLNKLTNYDKACFYLDFNNLVLNMTPSLLYYKYITNGSIYTGRPSMGLIFNGSEFVDWRNYKEYIDRSSKREIFIGAVCYDSRKGATKKMYHFSFDRQGLLTRVDNMQLE